MNPSPRIALLCAALFASAAFGNPQSPPKLAVVISVDQFRADYLERFEPYFGDNGFRRLLERGAVYSEARFRHALTATAPGHATLLSGSPPSVHGIVANSWLERATERSVGAVSDPTEQLVGAAPVSTIFPRDGASPRRFLGTTVGDQLKLRFGETCRVLSLSNKDRAAILMGGHSADAVYWLPTDRFVTSTYYRQQLPDWAEAFNREQSVDQLFGQKWDRLLPVEIYDRVQGPDSAAGEEIRHGLDGTFPRVVDGGLTAPGKDFYDSFRLSPDSTRLLAAFARAAIDAEQLGRHAAPDLICISFSQTDYVGHSFGPDSHEMMDTILRLDRVLAELFLHLDATLGDGAWIAVLSADHGCAPLPERAASSPNRLFAGRLDWDTIEATGNKALTDTFGPAPADSVWLVRDAYGFLIPAATVRASGQEPATLRRVLRDALLQHPQIESAWTRDEILENRPERNRPDFAAWQLSYHPDRSPDVVFTPKPYVVDRSPFGTNHGTPHDYDCHVPLIFCGPGIPAGHFSEPVTPEQLAPTLSRLLKIPRPPQANQPILPHIFLGDIGTANERE